VTKRSEELTYAITITGTGEAPDLERLLDLCEPWDGVQNIQIVDGSARHRRGRDLLVNGKAVIYAREDRPLKREQFASWQAFVKARDLGLGRHDLRGWPASSPAGWTTYDLRKLTRKRANL
jgi:hypothetical protein